MSENDNKGVQKGETEDNQKVKEQEQKKREDENLDNENEELDGPASEDEHPIEHLLTDRERLKKLNELEKQPPTLAPSRV